ncbi:MAG: hypothetical protein JRF40_00090 [Deltaproteobacteria bacterium]|nr:hypothetical protein [Deltaproteobacteria bacterium]MBW2217884.1 hypothetical protein [Deltaproteobacteria bacterium]
MPENFKIGNFKTSSFKISSFKKYLLPMLLIFLFTGCTVRLIYNHLDWIIPWYVSDYIDLNDDQDNLLDKKLFAQLKWHRVTQLTSYSKFLRQLKVNFNNGLKYEDLDRCHNQMRKFWQDLIMHAVPDIAKILSTASDEQIEEFLENLEKRNEKYKERYIDLTEEELRKKKVARMNRFLDFCMGDVNKEQEELVDNWSKKLKNISVVRFDFIKKSQKRLKKILRNRKDEETFSEDLTEFFFFRRRNWPPDLRDIAAHNRDLTKKTFIEIVNHMSSDQREYLNEQIDDLAEVFDELAAEKIDE